MYVKAIERVGGFTRGIHSIFRSYGSTVVQPGAATLFFVNDEGWAITCGHVADHLAMTEKINNRYRGFLKELSDRKGEQKARQLKRKLERKYGLDSKETAEIKNRFVNCVEGHLNLTIRRHPYADLALIKFENCGKILCEGFPIFAKENADLKPGKMLCRLGFPFPEFTNFAYDTGKNQIDWTETGKALTPRFPLDGMVTRHLRHTDGSMLGFEMSTPGIRGQSGGPAFDSDGKIWGVQAITSHHDLNFDVDQEVFRGGRRKRVQDSAFLHTGGCVHVEVVKDFMTENGVSFVQG